MASHGDFQCTLLPGCQERLSEKAIEMLLRYMLAGYGMKGGLYNSKNTVAALVLIPPHDHHPTACIGCTLHPHLQE
jgi:hypothetical protein